MTALTVLLLLERIWYNIIVISKFHVSSNLVQDSFNQLLTTFKGVVIRAEGSR